MVLDLNLVLLTSDMTVYAIAAKESTNEMHHTYLHAAWPHATFGFLAAGFCKAPIHKLQIDMADNPQRKILRRPTLVAMNQETKVPTHAMAVMPKFKLYVFVLEIPTCWKR